MKISYNWLKEFIQIDKTVEEVGVLLTQSGLEVEAIETYESLKGNLEGIVIGEVLSCVPHPNADKLKVATVDLGAGNIPQIVCGASNVAVGQKVVVATVGTMLYPMKGEPFEISKAKIRGAVSEGMICAEDEIGLGSSHEGIIVLDTKLPNGTPANQHFKTYKDFVFEIGLTPNRADAASHLGVSRDLKALLQKDIQLVAIDQFKIGNQKLTISVEVKNSEACPRYSGLTLSGVKVAESPDWLKNKLKSIGLSPINNVVDATNFILHGLGQPMHAFDADKIAGKKIIVQTLPSGTVFKTLDNIERKLVEKDLMICDGNGSGMCIAGVFGGINSGVSDLTQNIFLESAYFSPAFIRKSSQTHGLKTDASFRFERGTDPEITVYALKVAAMLIKEIAGGEISSEIIDIYPNPVERKVLSATYKNIDRLIGKSIAKERIKEILINLGFVYSKEDTIGFSVVVPSYKVDFQGEADIIEEILRIYGFNNIENSPILGSDYLASFPEVDKNKIQYKVSQLLSATGFSEIITNSLTRPEYANHLHNVVSGQNVQILNPLSEELNVLRQSLLFSGLEVLQHNINRKQKDLKIFEFGKVYKQIEGKYLEQQQLAMFLTGNSANESWSEKSAGIDFYDLKRNVELVLSKLVSGKIRMKPSESSELEYGLEVSLNNRSICDFGLLSKKILKVADLKQSVFFANFDWDVILQNYKQNIAFQEIPKFPEVRRDLSLVLDKAVSFKDIEALAKKYEKEILSDINVFDVYEGEKIGLDKKSYSVSFTLLDKTQTLTDKMIDRTMDKLMNAFEKELNAIIRK